MNKHAPPIARCHRPRTGLSIGIAHIPRQRYAAAVSRHRRPMDREDRIVVRGAVVCLVVLVLAGLAGWL